jgi:hypothetical protein
MPLKKKAIVIILPILVIGLLVAGYFIPIEVKTKQECGPSPVYRYKLGIYWCEINREAHPDLQCWKKIGGPLEYFGLKKIDCDH